MLTRRDEQRDQKSSRREIVKLPISLFDELKQLGVDVKSDEEGLFVFFSEIWRCWLEYV
jgi:hypothetical protein